MCAPILSKVEGREKSGCNGKSNSAWLVLLYSKPVSAPLNAACREGYRWLFQVPDYEKLPGSFIEELELTPAGNPDEQLH